MLASVSAYSGLLPFGTVSGMSTAGSPTISERETEDSEKVDEQGVVEVELPLEREEEVEKPKVGMSFESEEEVRKYYRRYANSLGFGIRKLSTKAGKNGVKYFSLACTRSCKPKSTSKNPFQSRQSSRTDCKAKINIVVGTDGRYKVHTVNLQHNHTFSVPGKVRQPRSNKESQTRGKRRLEQDDQAGISFDNNSDSLIEVEGCESSQYRMKFKQLRLCDGDEEALQDYLNTMRKKNTNFFFKLDINEQGHLRNVFWADARSRAAYEAFGDVISLDTTHLTSKCDIPLALFSGVNHHGQSMLLGCGLLSTEDSEAYLWLFRSWLECMSSHAPKAIITNESKAVQVAVGDVFPDSRWRLSVWHIMKKLPEKLSGLPQYHAIKKIMKCIVYESLRCDEFEEAWAKMIEEYNLLDNEWLKLLYSDRHRWVPVFVKDSFWAGLSTIQRRESMTALLDGDVNMRVSLKQFLEQYEFALKNIVEKENNADTASLNASLPLVTNLYIEKQFQQVYTHEIFKHFQEELKGMLYCNTTFVKMDGFIFTYEVTESVEVKDGKSRREIAYEVSYNEVECEVKCQCRSFEFKGILCRHSVSVLMKRKVNEVSNQYILLRWRKDIKRKHNFVKSLYDDFGSNEQMQRYDRLCNQFFRVAEVGAESTEKCKILMDCLDEASMKFVMIDSICGRGQPPQEPFF